MQTVKPASKTNRSPSRLRLSGGVIPLAGRRRVETLRGFCFSGRCFVVVRRGRTRKTAPDEGGRKTGAILGGIAKSLRSRLAGIKASRHHKTPSLVRARIDTAHGPAWAAPKKHRQAPHPALRLPAFLSGTEQASGATVEPTRLRLNDSLQGLWVQQCIGSGQEGTSFHPWQNYGQKRSAEKGKQHE